MGHVAKHVFILATDQGGQVGVVHNLRSGQGVFMLWKAEATAAQPVWDRAGTAVVRGRMLGSATHPIPQPRPFILRA